MSVVRTVMRTSATRPAEGRTWGRNTFSLIAFFVTALTANVTLAAEGQIFDHGKLDVRALIQAGGVVGYVIILLSVAMVALIVEHLLSIRRSTLIPRRLIDEVQPIIRDGNYGFAIERCRQHPSYLGHVLAAGLQEASLGYAAVEKAMEDASLEQAARLMRKIDYMSLIGAVGPMLGLLGTIWGMIQAFAEFAEKANPTAADFAPAISEALVTTLFGLCVAIPASAAYVWFRNRIDEIVAEASLIAVHLTGPMKRALAGKKAVRRDRNDGDGHGGSDKAAPVPRPAGPAGPAPVVREREGTQ